MSDLLALAMACDLTRVFSVQHSIWHTGVFADIGSSNDYHTYTHEEPQPQNMVQKHVVFIMESLAYFLEKLQSTQLGAQTLLDQCGILCTTEVAEGSTHATNNMPMIVAGRAGGALKTGFHHKGAAENTSKVHLTLLKAVGAQATEFGTGDGRVTDTVSALLA
jgi:hypothetical protein